MGRGIVIAVLIIIASFLIFESLGRNAGAQDAVNLNQVIQNQQLIIEKLNNIDVKLRQIRMRIR